MSERKPVELIAARPASDGDGVKMLRVFGGGRPERFDPFLMLDEFGSDQASDYIGGFPPHPHRGFETITYMLRGKMEHRDHMNNVGLLKDGDVQWMTAARGIIHSEMPQQTEGQMRGFQVWLNLPSAEKMADAHYQDVAAAQLPVYERGGVKIIAIAGEVQLDGQAMTGYFHKEATRPVFWDVHLSAAAKLQVPLDETLNVLIYVYEGSVQVGGTDVGAQHLVRLGEGRALSLYNGGPSEARLLVLAGRPLREPISQYGPFVMNKPAEIEQAIADYRAGRLTH